MTSYQWANAPCEVRAQIDVFVAQIREITAENLVGIYLHGSLALGCYHPAHSDIDLLVITREALASSIRREIGQLLLICSKRPSPIEISFLRRSDMVPWRHPAPFDLHYSETWRGQYERDLAGEEWRTWGAAEQRDSDLAAHITVTRARGICLAGAPIAETFPYVPREDYLASVAEDIAWATERSRELSTYLILNMCRTLGYLREECVLSKAEGGAWALEHLPAMYHSPIEVALRHYLSDDDRQAPGITSEWLTVVASLRLLLCQAGLPLASLS